jgi:GT2 family glycosyltransferase
VLGITVVVATRNRATALRRTLERLVALPGHPPVIVVDNASTDATPDLLARTFPKVRVIALERNEGAPARNHGVAAADTPYVAFADDDSWWAPDALPRARALFDAHPRLALLAARTLVGPREWLDPISAFMATAPLGSAEDLPGPSVLGFLACAAIVRRDAFLACGGFDPVVCFMGEEERLAYDLAAKGWGLAYRADVVAHHHPESRNDPDALVYKRMLALRNRALTGWLRRPVRVAWVDTVALLRAAASAGATGRAAIAGFLARLPLALATRCPPDPSVEATLARLGAAAHAAGYRTHAPVARPVPAEG